MIKKALWSFLAVLLLASVVSAQTCTPVKLSRSYTTRDDGTGPYFSFNVDGHTYPQEASLTVTSTSLVTYIYEQGWVDVFAGFGGCTQSWNLTGFGYYYGLYDLTIGRWVYDTALQTPGSNIPCGRVPACAFNFTGNTYTLNTVAGHKYHLWGFFMADTTVGETNWYSDYVTITVN